MNIPVSRSAWFAAENRTQRGTGPLPTAYPWGNAFVTLPDTSRILPTSNMPGSQAADPRASQGFGSASYVIVPSNEEMFNRASSVGGDYYAGNGGLFSRTNLINIILAALISYALFRYIKR